MSDVRERPILFSAPMIRAILAGTKTQTRRVIPDSWWRCLDPEDESDRDNAPSMCPFGVPPDRLWVRETWASAQEDIVAYRADGRAGAWMGDGEGGRLFIEHGWIVGAAEENRRGRWMGLAKFGERWRPSIFMPRWASRLTLEVTEVRVQRLQEITEEEAQAEGVTEPMPIMGTRGYVAAFSYLWDEINGKRVTWESNPFVWAISFKRLA